MRGINGVYGRYLDVNLSSNSIGVYEIPEGWYAKHLGGRGIATRIFLEELSGGEDPLGPENLLVFATGPFQGTGVAGAGRHVVVSRSPQTKTIHDSYVGGFLGHEIGRSGYDGIIIRGTARSPKALVVAGSRTEIADVSELWGQDVGTTTEALERRWAGAHVACIGPAGEKLIPFSCIMHDRTRAAGRAGLGAVMGAKRLKAIVIRGHQEKTPADPKRFSALRTQFARELLEDPLMGAFGELGTPGVLMPLNALGVLPTSNFRDGEFEHARDISGERMKETILVGRETCTGCPVRCKRVCKGSFAGEAILEEYGGPEYETLAAFGSLCLNATLEGIALANQKCNQYGLDTISTGVLIAFAMEATERGLLKPGIRWGDAEGTVRVIDGMITGEGTGGYLAKGLDAVARDLGGGDFAVLIKGVAVPMHDPRGRRAWG
jgi:aldehyde:ferredoxin oxidoreductase